MRHHRILALSAFVLCASGAVLFACSGDDNASDGGAADANADSSLKKDAAKDAMTFPDSSTKDATVQDAEADSTTSDADAEADATADGGDGGDDGSTDASLDGGMAATTFVVVRVGGDVDAGSDAGLTSASTQVFLEERNISDGSLVQTIAMPTAVNGANQPLTVQGSSTSEGALATTADGHHVVLAGYAAAPGVAKIGSTAIDAGVLRVIGLVGADGGVDTTTELAAFNKSNIRSATSSDGTAFWAVGSGNTNEGPQYVLLGSTGATTTISADPANLRVAQIFDGQLYVSTGSGAFHGVSAVGTGLPTTTGQTTTLLPGMPGDAGSAYGFSMLDQDASVTGLDVLYVADDSTNGGGIQKWVFDGTTWTQITTFTDQATKGFRGVTAFLSGNDVIVLGTTADTAAPSTVVKYVDDGQNLTPTGTVLATAPTNTFYRGIALSPQ